MRRRKTDSTYAIAGDAGEIYTNYSPSLKSDQFKKKNADATTVVVVVWCGMQGLGKQRMGWDGVESADVGVMKVKGGHACVERGRPACEWMGGVIVGTTE